MIFFTEQPVVDAAVFYVKNVLHDWSDRYAATILQQLRKFAAPDTMLILSERILCYACHDPGLDRDDSVSGSTFNEAPPTLLPNFGGANELPYLLDMIVSAYCLCRWFSIADRAKNRCLVG